MPERLVAEGALTLLRRNPGKYLPTVSGLYLLSLKDHHIGSVARATYFFFRQVDDLLDGDSASDADPLKHACALKSQIESGEFTGQPKIGLLAKYAIEAIAPKMRPGDNVQGDFTSAIDALIFDHHRMQNRRVLTQEEIQAHYLASFQPLINITLIAVESKFRAPDIPEFATCQGRIYSIRDLKQDWRQGIINIPAHVLDSSELTPESDFSQVTRDRRVKGWVCYELLDSSRSLDRLEEKIDSSGEKLTQAIIGRKVGYMRGLAKRLLKVTA